LHGIAEAEMGLGKPDAALHSLRSSLEIRRTLAARDPLHVGWQGDAAESLWKTGTVLEQQGAEGQEAAAEHYRQSLAILRPLAAQERLAADRKAWIPAIETLLNALDNATALAGE
jgi:hypothetical protein